MPPFQLSVGKTPRAEKGTDTEQLQRRKQKEIHEKGGEERVLSPTPVKGKETGTLMVRKEKECFPVPAP